MQDDRRLTRFWANRFARRGFHVHSQPGAHHFRYRHILVSTTLDIADRAALLLGFELASVHQSALTLLHVLPRCKQDRRPLGLDAIDLLHAAAEELRGTSAAHKPSEAAPPRLRKLVEDYVPQGLQDAVVWRAECRPGDVAETIVSYVNESSADLVILSAKPFRWWLPILPFDVWTIERRARAHVIVIRSQAPFQSSRRPC